LGFVLKKQGAHMFKPYTPEKIQEWKERILQQQNSGLSIARWCQEHQVAVGQFNYWKSKLFPRQIEATGFTEIVDTKNTGVAIEYGGMRIHLDPNFDATTLKRCLSYFSLSPPYEYA
jgi:hypothetical protein